MPVGEDAEKLKLRLPLLDYLRQQNWTCRSTGHGAEFVGLCPLHLETRPSFYVNARKNLFYCHGCGQGGDLLRFVQLSRHLSFCQSLAYLQQQGAPPRRPCRRSGASRHFLSKPTRSPSRGTRLSEPTRTARFRHDPRIADWLCSRRVLARTSHRSRVFFRFATASRLAQSTGPRCLLSARGLPLLPGRACHQSLRPQDHCRLRPSIPSRLEGWLVCLGSSSTMPRGHSRRGAVRLCRVVAGGLSARHLLVGHTSECLPVATVVRPNKPDLSHLRCRP